MTVFIRLFASARDAVGASELSLDVTERETVGRLIAMLAGRYPNLRPMVPFLRVAVNAEYATPETIIGEDAEVAVMPPVSGG